MTVGLETIPWTVPEYWFYTVFSIFNGILFTGILIFLLAIPKYAKYLKTNVFAGVTLVAIVIESFIRPFVMFEVIADFNEECYEDGNRDCDRCDIAGQLQKLFIIIGVVARSFMILKVLENTFQLFQFLAYPHWLIIGIKTFLAILCIIYSVLLMTVYQFPYHVYQMIDDANLHVCNIAFDDKKAENPKTFMAIFSAIMLSFQLFFCYLFIRKSLALYQITKDKIELSNYEQVKKTIRKMLHGIIIPIIRHSMMVVAITISHAFLVVMYRFVQPNEMPLDIIENLIVGACIMIMFPFGETCFNFVCGCVERGIVKKWLQVEILSLAKRKQERAMSVENMNEKQSLTEQGTKVSRTETRSKSSTKSKSSQPNDVALHSVAKELAADPVQLMKRDEIEKLVLKKEPSREVTVSITAFSRWGSKQLPELEIIGENAPKLQISDDIDQTNEADDN